MHVQLAVLPVSQRTTRLEGLMACIRGDEGLVENQRSVLETGLEITVRPLVRSLAHRQLAFVVFAEVLLGPFQLADFDRAGRLTGLRGRARPGIAFQTCVGAAWPQTH